MIADMRTVRLNDFDLTLHVHDAPELVSDTLHRDGIWEAYETRVLTTLLGPGMTFVDAGANLGYYAAIGACLVGRAGRVLAFEPDSGNFDLLVKNVAAFPQVTCLQHALGRDAGTMAFALSADNRGDHRLSLATQETSVSVIRGDDVIDGVVDVVKIDTQGAELMVIDGLWQTLFRSRDRLSMIIEFWPAALEQLGSSAHDVIDRLEALGLNLWIIDHEGDQLVPAMPHQLHELVDTIMAPATGGFMNLLASSRSNVVVS